MSIIVRLTPEEEAVVFKLIRTASARDVSPELAAIAETIIKGAPLNDQEGLVVTRFLEHAIRVTSSLDTARHCRELNDRIERAMQEVRPASPSRHLSL
jgi:hypothetical protein